MAGGCLVIQNSLKDIDHVLGRFKEHNQSSQHHKEITKTSTNSYENTLISDALNELGETIVIGLGLGGGAVLLDMFFTMGLASVTAFVVFMFFSSEEDHKAKQREKIKDKMDEQKPKIIKKLVDDTFSTYKQNIVKKYNEEIDLRLNQITDELWQAENDLKMSVDERKAVEIDMNQSKDILRNLKSQLKLILKK